MIFQNTVTLQISVIVEGDAVNSERIAVKKIIRNPVSFDQLQIEFDVIVRQIWILGHENKTFSVLALSNPDCPKPFCQMDLFTPNRKITFDLSIQLLIRTQHLKPRPAPNAVIGQRFNNPASV